MLEFRLPFHWSLYLRVFNNITALVQIMAWRRLGDKPLSEPMMVNLLTHICVTRPQWVNYKIFICYPYLVWVCTFFELEWISGNGRVYKTFWNIKSCITVIDCIICWCCHSSGILGGTSSATNRVHISWGYASCLLTHSWIKRVNSNV